MALLFKNCSFATFYHFHHWSKPSSSPVCWNYNFLPDHPAFTLAPLPYSLIWTQQPEIGFNLLEPNFPSQSESPAPTEPALPGLPSYPHPTPLFLSDPISYYFPPTYPPCSPAPLPPCIITPLTLQLSLSVDKFFGIPDCFLVYYLLVKLVSFICIHQLEGKLHEEGSCLSCVL